MVKRGRCCGVARRSVYYRPTKAQPKVRPEQAEPIKSMIEEKPSFGYRTVAGLLGMNKNGAADLPAQGLAGAQAGGGQPPTDPSFAIGGDSPRPTLGHRPVPDLGW